GGLPGTLQQLRVRVYLDLAQGLDPLDRLRDGQPADGTGSRPGQAPVKAVINLLVPVGTLLGWSFAPGDVPGFGLLDPQATRDLVETASRHPETRWCATIIGADGTAAAHGCATGQHPWQPSRAGPSVAEFLRWLRVEPSRIARGGCDHRHYSGKYVISRKVKHLIQARASTCTAPGCHRPAAEADADHTIPWPDGPSCECNLGAPCRYHHRNKQAPGWHLDQPEPGVFSWRNPSGRTHTTYPTRYIA
ncbi:MAG TPA: HNH endonuclease signature motif containing protein, partial [Trebonia sp.]